MQTATHRILQLCPHDSAPFGGLVQLYQQAAAALHVELDNVILGTPSDQPLAGVSYLNMTDMSDTRALSKALAGWAEQNWTLILCHRYRAYRAAMGADMPAERCVAVAHEYGLLGRWQRRMNRLLFARKVRFAGVSAPVAQELADVTGHYLVLPNALDVGADQPQLLDRTQARQALGMAAEGFAVGVIGRLHYKKRPQLALQAFAEFCAQHKDAANAQLIFLGDGQQREQLQSMAVALQQRHADAQILLPGVVPNARQYMSAFDVVLYPAVADSFGMVALEAMHAGVPVVCKPGHGPQYVLQDLGIYAQQDTAQGYADGLSKARQLDVAGLRQQMRQRVEQHFSVSSVARVLDHLLLEAG